MGGKEKSRNGGGGVWATMEIRIASRRKGIVSPGLLSSLRFFARVRVRGEKWHLAGRVQAPKYLSSFVWLNGLR